MGFPEGEDSFLYHIPSTRQSRSQLSCPCLRKNRKEYREKRGENSVFSIRWVVGGAHWDPELEFFGWWSKWINISS